MEALPLDVLRIIGKFAGPLGMLQLRFVSKRLSSAQPKYSSSREQKVWATYCYYEIIQSGSLEFVQWAIKLKLDARPGWFFDHIGVALLHGHLHLLEVLERQTINRVGYDKTYDAAALVLKLAEDNRVDSIEWLFNNGFARFICFAYRPAVTLGHYYMIQVIHRLIGSSRVVMEQAIRGGFFKIIKWLSLHDYPYEPMDRYAVLGKWGFDLDTKDWAYKVVFTRPGDTKLGARSWAAQ